MKKNLNLKLYFTIKPVDICDILSPASLKKNNEMYNAHTDAIGNLIG